MTTLLQDQTRVGNAGKPGYDTFGDPVKTAYNETSSPVGPVVASAGNAQVLANQQAAAKLGLSIPGLTQSTTTLSSDKSKDISNIKSTTDNLSKTGITTDPTSGVSTYADGSVYNLGDTNEPVKSTSGISTGGYVGETYYPVGAPLPVGSSVTKYSPTDLAVLDNIEKQKGQVDSLTAGIIGNIQRQYQDLIDSQKSTNEQQEAGVTKLLLRNGGLQHTGSGTNVISSQIDYGISQLADLNNKEQMAIMEAQNAGLKQKFQLQDKINTEIKDIRDKKVAIAKSMNETIVAANKKISEDKMQAQKDSAISSLYTSGITDAAQIMTELRKNGYTDVTAKDVSDTLKNIVPPGLDDLVKTLRTNGAPQDVIQKVLSSTDINSAYEAAGSYGAGGTGIIGEYNYYKAQAEANGQNPVSFNEYQNLDANRKIKIAQAANAAGLTSAMTNTALKLSDDYEARSKDYYSQREAYNRIQSSASDPSPAGDLALIFNYMKVLDPNSTVREGEFANAQNAGSAYEKAGATYNKVVNGKRLTEAQRKDFVDRSEKLFNGAKTQQDAVVSEFKDRATKYGVPPDLVVRDTSATGSNAKDLVQAEEQAKTKVLDVSKSNPDAASAIRVALGQGTSYADIILAFPEYFK